jgi:NDP-sugar pyrophosphorylase family protein
MSKHKYLPLTPEAIKILKRNGCWSRHWEKIMVSKGFDPTRIAGTIFRGEVRIGRLDGHFIPRDGIRRYAGIFDANLHNVSIGDNCHISNINGWLSNLVIQDQVLIEDVGSIVCQGETSFGNGHSIEILNEGGGRELKITEITSAQTAYLTTLYRHDPELIQALDQIADDYARRVKSDRATIGRGSYIFHCQNMVNVKIGEHAVLRGIQNLKEGTVASSKSAATFVGDGVIAKNFIIQKGAHVSDGALLHGTLIGEGSQIGKQFSSENSALFSNSEGFHSEVCSIFGGPYTVTHHRSTLLIAGMFSFFNAGSGTNQSNHMYKLGPLHQGILERGCKTGSSSYLLWPSRVGAFSAIMGKHYANFDTSDFPFSYVNEDNGKSTLVPGMNFFTVGTMRDGLKWPTRDRRANADKLDQLIFNVLSPYTAQKMIKGQAQLLDLYAGAERGQEYVNHQGILIKRLLLKTCSRYYRMALEKYFGDILVTRLQASTPADLKDFLTRPADAVEGKALWIDVSGLLCAKPRLASLLEALKAGTINDSSALQQQFESIHAGYADDEWSWVLHALPSVFGFEEAALSVDDLELVLKKWQVSSIKLLNMVEMDASKEFEGNVRTGFGIDGFQDEDFDAVRGSFEDNSFKHQLDEMRLQIAQDLEQSLSILKKL